MKISFQKLACFVSATAIAISGLACGGGKASKTVTTTTTKAKTVTGPTDDGTVPNGVLTTSAIGSIKVGSSQADVVSAFGAPDKKDTSDPEAVVWQWKMKNGVVKMRFEQKKMRSYFTDSTVLKTKSGFHVGDEIKNVMKKVNLQQTGVRGAIGEETYTLSEGSAGTYPALAFEVTKGVVVAISGGDDWSGAQSDVTSTLPVTTAIPTTTVPVTPTTAPVPTVPPTTTPVVPTDNGGVGTGQ